MLRKLTHIGPSAEVRGNAGLNRALMIQLHGRFMPGCFGMALDGSSRCVKGMKLTFRARASAEIQETHEHWKANRN